MYPVTTADYYTGSKTRPAVVDIRRIDAAGQRTLVNSIPVAGKAEARRVAKEHGATPWNF